MFFAGDFNCHSQLWYNEEITDAEGGELEEPTSMLELIQLLHGLVNDVIFTEQPNLVIERGIHSSLDNYCHHQITYCSMNNALICQKDLAF